MYQILIGLKIQITEESQCDYYKKMRWKPQSEKGTTLLEKQ